MEHYNSPLLCEILLSNKVNFER